MSKQNAMSFIQELEGNANFQNQIQALSPGDSDGLVKLAFGLGFEFTVQEVQAVVANVGELNDGQLDQVVGGIFDIGCQPVSIGLLLPVIQPDPAKTNTTFGKVG